MSPDASPQNVVSPVEGDFSTETPVPEADQPRARAAWGLDGALIGAGAAFGWSSLTFPFGVDQGLYYYVAREWVVRGAIPYRDVLDHKTPGIYVLHALAIRLFGQHMWGIRILDLVCVLALGLLAAGLTAPRGQRPATGVRGAACLAASLLFYGFFDFWNTAQSELWYSALGVASIWAIQRIRREPLAQLSAGLLGGAALLMKPPAIWFILIAIGILVIRVLEHPEAPQSRPKAKRLVQGLLRMAAGGAALPLLVLFYFGAHHALGAMFEMVVKANSYYATHERGINNIGDVFLESLMIFRIYSAVAVVLLLGLAAGLGVALRLGDRPLRNRHLLAALLCAAGFLAVLMQLKFYLLHWGAVIGPAVAVAANLAADCVAADRALRAIANRTRTVTAVLSRPSLWLGPAVFVAAMVVAWVSCGPSFDMWATENRKAAGYLKGRVTREDFNGIFLMPRLNYIWNDSEKVGLWLRDHTTPDDFIAVRGFSPEIYAVAERRYPGRMFWTIFMVSSLRESPEKRAQWLEEDRQALKNHPPKYAVTISWVHDGPDSSEWFYPLGYKKKFDLGKNFSVLEREPAATAKP